MRRTFFSLPAVATVLLTATAFALTTVAQTAPPAQTAQPTQAAQPGPGQPPPGGAPPPHNFPAPTNLKVLPKNITGEQLHNLMHQWSGSLGVRCTTCHAADPKKVGPDGKPLLNYADDSKEQKRTARAMYRMSEEINAKYVSKVPNSDTRVTCGTCHRGNLDPEPFVIPDPHAAHAHDAPPPAEKAPPTPY